MPKVVFVEKKKQHCEIPSQMEAKMQQVCCQKWYNNHNYIKQKSDLQKVSLNKNDNGLTIVVVAKQRRMTTLYRVVQHWHCTCSSHVIYVTLHQLYCYRILSRNMRNMRVLLVFFCTILTSFHKMPKVHKKSKHRCW